MLDRLKLRHFGREGLGPATSIDLNGGINIRKMLFLLFSTISSLIYNQAYPDSEKTV